MRLGPLHTVLALLLVFAIVAITIAPSVDLAPTTLGAQQSGLLASSALLATALSALLAPHGAVLHGWWPPASAPHLCSLLDLICSRLC
jgi:hypothetical protein